MKHHQLLSQALSACGENRTEMAAKLGVSRQVVQGWLRRKKLPSWRIDAVRRLAGKAQ